MKARNKPAPSRDLLTLSMIVKDEAKSIARTLASVKPFIDRWSIVDTGSTDDTREIVKRELEGVPGELSEAPFVDFSTTRNLALDRCGEHTAFILWLDADDELRGGASLRPFLGKERALSGPDHDAFLIRIEAGVSFSSARILRSRSEWRFKGAVHEVLSHPTQSPPMRSVPGVSIFHDPGADAIERSRARRERDIVLLKDAVQRDKTDARSAFYLAMTYLWLERYDEAIEAFRKRIELGGWLEELYLAKQSLAEAAERRGDRWNDVLPLYLDAHATAPHRAEPLYRIALHYNSNGEHALCLVFARRALDLPYPARDVHFIDRDVYTWKIHDLIGSSAFWLGEYELGEKSAQKAVELRPSDTRLANNLAFYRNRKKR